MRKVMVLFVLVLLVSAAGTPLLAHHCIDDPCVNCGWECGTLGEDYGCWEPGSPSDACIDCGGSNCGFSGGDSCCHGGFGAF